MILIILLVFCLIVVFFVWSLAVNMNRSAHIPRSTAIKPKPNAIEKHLSSFRSHQVPVSEILPLPVFTGQRSDVLKQLYLYISELARSSPSLRISHCPREVVFDYVRRGGLELFASKRDFFLLQCFLLTRVRWISSDFHCHSLSANALRLLGSSLNDLYPVVVEEKAAFFVYSLLFDFGYGPNLFPWHRYRVEEDNLDGVPTTFYLVRIDVGSLLGGVSDFVWKVGITFKPVVGVRGRFSGKYSKFVSILREINYSDGRIAFMKEQTYLQMAPSGSFERALEPWQYRLREVDLVEDEGIDPFQYLSKRDVSVLGLSEWVFGAYKTPKRAIALFEQLTQY